MRRTFSLLLAALMALCVLGGCSAKELPAIETHTELQTESTAYIADGYDVLGGLWWPGGMYYDGKLIDMNDYETIKDLYDSQFLTVKEDGTFEFFSVFGERGTYSRYEKGPEGYSCFLLRREEVYRQSFENGELVEIPDETAEKRTYLVEIPNEDENTLILHTFDPLTGGPAADDDPLVYVKDGCESSFIEKYKTPAK